MAITTNFSEAVVDLVTDLVSADQVTLANAFYEKTFEVSDFAQAHTIIPGIREGKVIPIISNSPRYDKFPYKAPTSCDIPACDLDLPFAAKNWEVGMIACKIPICVNEFDENFLLFFNQYKRLFGDADLNGALMSYISGVFERDLKAATWRIGYFGDRTIDSGDANYDLLRPINGIFTQAEAGDGRKIVVTENDTPGSLTGEAVYEYLKTAYEYASLQPWFDTANMQFEMTKAMAAVWVSWLNGLGDSSAYNCDCYNADGVTAARRFSLEGVNKAFGLPVIVRQEFDGVIQQLGLGNPYRALLTTKDNILFGTSELDQIQSFKMWYSQDDDKIYIKGGTQMGASLVTDDYVYIGAETANTPTT